MKRMIITLAFATVAGALTLGVAASMPVTSANLGSGAAEVESCDSDGFHVTYVAEAGDPRRITAVTVNDIEQPGCELQTLSIVVSDAGGLARATAGDIIGAATSQTFTLSDVVLAADIGEVAVTIAG